MARQYAEWQTREQLLSELANIAGSAVEAANAWQTMVQKAAQAMDALCGLYLVDQSGRQLDLVVGAWAGEASDDAPTLGTAELGRGIVGRVASSGLPHLAVDVRNDEWAEEDRLGARGIVSIAAVPIAVRRRTLGVFAVARVEGQCRLTATDLDFSVVVAAVMAAVAESERCLRQERRLRHEKEEFVSIVAHEFKTPLTAIKGFAQLVARRLGPSADDGTLRALQTISAQADKLAQLATGLTLYSRLQSGKIEMEKRPAELVALIRASVDSVRMPQDSRYTFVVETEEAVLPLVCDPDRVQQVIIALLTNAVKYSPQGGEIRVTARRADGMLAVSVHDQGVGIAPEQQEHVFTSFYRRHHSGNEAEGQGLGLAIARAIVEAHGGHIGLRSVPAQGSTFYFTLPAS